MWGTANVEKLRTSHKANDRLGLLESERDAALQVALVKHFPFPGGWTFLEEPEDARGRQSRLQSVVRRGQGCEDTVAGGAWELG